MSWWRRRFRLRVAILLHLLTVAAFAATRPHYGGTLRVEVRPVYDSPDPPTMGRGMADLAGGFTIARWEAGRRAVYEAEENAAGGRPFLDSVEIAMGRPLRDQSIDLELGRADLVELGPNELRRQPPGRRVWFSAPVRILALVFGPRERENDARLREALALAVDRSAIHTVLLQRQGEISGALLPQWLSGYAFLFPTQTDLGKARGLAAGARAITLSVEDSAARPIAERIAVNARDAGLTVFIAGPGAAAAADVRLVELRVSSLEPARALAGLAAALGFPGPSESPRIDSPEALLAAERALLEGFRVIPLIHLPDIYGAGPRVKGAPGITPLGEWRFADLWMEGERP